MNKVRIVIADDHAVVRSGLKQFFGATEDLEIVAEAASGLALLDLAKQVMCDVVLLDISLPDLNGLEVLRRLKLEKPTFHVLIFSMFPEDDFAIPALNDGAAGYLCKDSPPEEILLALRTVAKGSRYVSPRLAEKLLDHSENHGKQLLHETLSPREMSVMLLLSKGVSLTHIGDQLHLSVKTVSTYRTRILAKLNLSSNAEITRYVVEHKLG